LSECGKSGERGEKAFEDEIVAGIASIVNVDG